MLVEARDLILIGFGAVVLLLLARLPRGASSPAERGHLAALLAQLTAAHERIQSAEGWARTSEERARAAEAKAAQLQAMVDNLLPAAVSDRQTITALRIQLQERNQELDVLKAGLGLR